MYLGCLKTRTFDRTDTSFPFLFSDRFVIDNEETGKEFELEGTGK